MLDYIANHKILTSFAVVLLLIAGCFGYRIKGPYRSYRADLARPATGDSATPGVLEVGVAKRDITPNLSLYDTWTDADGDSKFNESKGDSWTDSNGNGKMDLVWMAGFSNNRPAKGVNDPLWVRAIAFRNNGVTLAMVTIDSIGIFHEKFIAVRKSIDPSLEIDHVLFSTSHNHEAPDTMGIWSYSPIRPKFDYAYMERVKLACKEAVEEAVRNLQPADMILADKVIAPEGFVDDSRKPIVYDLHVCSARFVKHGSDETIGTMVSWGNHTETLGGSNSLLTSDFLNWVRLGVESGVSEPNGVEGFGGMCLYFQGMVGGLMTQLHTTVPHRDGVQKFDSASFEKAQALGENVAIVVANSLRSPEAIRTENPKVQVVAKTIFVPMEGLYGAACMLGLVHPGWYWGKGKSEVNAIRIGDLEILTIPGELYPEIAEGGIESPVGADFPGEPVEVPPLRKQMRGKVNMIFGLANDEIGYIIPRTQWDVEPPYAYGETEEPQYGEENSGGSEIAPVIHRESLAVLEQLHAMP
ncbi:MAG: hypothetical protein IT364_26915 [Candidatus Hydrogenedentes bacterium]|nr:hypothetical protein [Candidatus Hydrogenedentota bacterium]